MAVLLTDVSGSTRLYEERGDVAAREQMLACLARLTEVVHANTGRVLHSKGDDVLCVFDDARHAMAAARTIMGETLSAELSVHSGLHWGPVLLGNGDAHGTAVNIASRLAAKANPGEVLVSGEFVSQLQGRYEGYFRMIGELPLKGASAPLRVLSILDADVDMRTRPIEVMSARRESRTVALLEHGGRRYEVGVGQEFLIGRGEQCDIVLEESWISRVHAEISVEPGLVEFTDRSSTGSYVSVDGAGEVFLRRRSVALSGTGLISLGMSCDTEDSLPIRFSVDAEPTPDTA